MNKIKFEIDRIIYFSYFALAIITPLIFTTQNTELYEVPKMMFVYTAATVILFATILKWLLEKKVALPKNKAFMAFAALTFVQLLSTFTSQDKYTSIFGFPSRLNGGMLSQLTYLVIFGGALINLNPQKAKKIIYSIIVTALVVSLWGIPAHFGRDPSCFVLTGKLSSTCWQKDFDPTLRIFSTLGQPNWLASYLVLTLPITLSLVFVFKRRKTRIFLIAASSLIFLAIILTNSRSGALGAAISIAVFLILAGTKTIRSNIKTLALLTVVFTVITLFFASSLKARINQTVPSPVTQQLSDPETQQPNSPANSPTESGLIRLIVWKGAIEIFKTSPILGTGPETFVSAYYLTRPTEHNQTSEWEFFYNKAHNEFLNYLANTGALGLVAYLTFAVITIYQIAQVSKKRTEESQITKAAAGGIIGYLVTIFFGFSTVATQTIAMVIIASSLVLLKKQEIKTYDIPFKNQKALKLSVGIAIVLLFFVLSQVLKLYLSDSWERRAESLSAGRQLIAYSNATTAHPTNNPYLLANFANAIALYLTDLNDDQKAKELASQADYLAQNAIAVSPNNYLVNQKVAKTYLLIFPYNDLYKQKAQDLGQKLTILAPTYPISYLTYAKILVLDDKSAEAMVQVKKALNLKPDYLEARQLLDQLEQKTKRQIDN